MKRLLTLICLGLMTAGHSWADNPESKPDTRHMSTKQLQTLVLSQSKSTPGRTYVKARMLATPASEAKRKYYPAAAKAVGQKGVALAECQFDQMGNLINCESMAEEPRGFEFGEATVTLAQKYFTLDMRDLHADSNNKWVKIMLCWPN
ncbi:MAG: hypothetical protein NVV72_15685 [Asticcacaulis sp.]|nr:hypothetical protein [Asticcacaulis sp.]